MTAMGAGSVLSLLHSFERPVLVLHGHKHIASARKLEGMRDGEGDVILASAGSAATAQRWSPRTDERWADANSGGDAVRIWPSFNVVELDGDALAIETVSFGWKGRSAGRLANRPLVWAERRGARWSVTPTTSSEPRMGPALRDNRAHVRLWASARHALRLAARALASGRVTLLARSTLVCIGLSNRTRRTRLPSSLAKGPCRNDLIGSASRRPA